MRNNKTNFDLKFFLSLTIKCIKDMQKYYTHLRNIFAFLVYIVLASKC